MTSGPKRRPTTKASAKDEKKKQNGARPRGRPKQLNNKRYEERRNEVIETAARVFAERGFHETTVDDLVEATGLQRGGLYHYIEGKDDLLVHIHGQFIEPLLAEAKTVGDSDASPEAMLRELGRILMHDIATYLPQVTVFLHEWRIVEHGPEWKEIRRARREFENVISSVLQRGVEDGSFEIADVRIATLSFLGMFNYSYQWLRPGGRIPHEALANQFCDIFLGGVKKG